MVKFTIIALAVLFSAPPLCGQEKRDFQWIIGYDYSGLPDQTISMNFLENPLLISHVATVSGFGMEGSNTSMSNAEGNLLFYSNGCMIINSKGEVMLNGDSINPGIIQNFYCSGGGSPLGQGVISLPAPESDSLYYVFNLDMDQPYLNSNFLGVAPQRLFYQVVDMVQDSGFGAVTQKNQIAVQDTFARGNISAARHANGKDWWVIVPKSHSNCYFLVPITSEGVQAAQLKCSGHEWSDDDSGAQATFSPDLKKYIRFNAWNGLNIFDFNNATGDLSNPVHILFPNDTIKYIAGVAVSANSKYLYLCARKRVYQFDLHAADIEASKVKVAEWDGFSNPSATNFYLAALAPDGKIYISSTSSTLNLHVIEKPNCPGLSCQLIQHGVELPSYNFATIPNFPHYRMSSDGCDTITNSTVTIIDKNLIAIYPNPTKGEFWLNYPEIDDIGIELNIFNLFGRLVFYSCIRQPLSKIDIFHLNPGAYIYLIKKPGMVNTGKIMKIE
jgi:Secretion system C-terminal sorting domain